MYKAKDIAKWIIKNDIENKTINDEKGELMSNARLQFTLYFFQGFIFALTGKPLFCDNICKWKKCPSVPSIYRKYKDYKYNPAKIRNIYIDGKTEDNLKAIFNWINDYSVNDIRKMVRESTPWIETESNKIIPAKKIGIYFRENYLD